jgi:aminoglycoside 6'-N-acetyltransferase
MKTVLPENLTIDGERVNLRPIRESDETRVMEILSAPAVAEWWGEYDRARMRRDLFEDPWFAVELEGSFIGVVGFWEENEPQYRHAGIDIALGPAWHGRGLGADAVRTLARWLFEERGHHRITIDPAAANARAIRSYEQVGFRPVGVMRRYERIGGEYRDGLLMDLLPEELGSPTR